METILEASVLGAAMNNRGASLEPTTSIINIERAGVFACAAAALAIALALIWGAQNSAHPLEATAQMERLAAKIERTKSLPLETASEIRRLMSQPWSDCAQIACSVQLQMRNSAVRARLTTLLAAKTIGSDVAGAEQKSPRSARAAAQ
jgi:hypothetical protein